MLGFAHTVGEFGVVLMIGGNIPGKTRVVSVQIYDHVEALEYAAGALARRRHAGVQLRRAAGAVSRCYPQAGWTAERAQSTLVPRRDRTRAFASSAALSRSTSTCDLPGRGVSALFGHSGLRQDHLLALPRRPRARAAAATSRVDDEVWQDDAAAASSCRRTGAPLGYVFQEASLFAHLTVRGNLEFGSNRVPPASAASHLTQAARTARHRRICSSAGRQRLSGGERQRVAIARALLASPAPAAAGRTARRARPPKRKQEILPYLERLHDELAIPILYVSHAPDEVARLADHLVLLDAGRVVASGPLTRYAGARRPAARLCRRCRRRARHHRWRATKPMRCRAWHSPAACCTSASAAKRRRHAACAAASTRATSAWRWRGRKAAASSTCCRRW